MSRIRIAAGIAALALFSLFAWRATPHAARTAILVKGPPEAAAPDAAKTSEPTRAQLMGDVQPTTAAGFAPIGDDLAAKGGLYGRREAVEAFEKMAAAAKADGVRLTVISAFRSFGDQKRIWENKWNGVTPVAGGRLPDTTKDPKARALKILEFSSMPGTSRHHWGTDFDLNALDNVYFSKGKGKAAYAWLAANAGKFGFCQPYSARGPNRPAGYNEEKWHWSYKPISSVWLAQFARSVTDDDIKGFDGSQTAKSVHAVEDYVRGVNRDCKG